MTPAASTVRWQRLTACLLASLALHIAIVVPHLQPFRPDDAPPALLVRIVGTPPPAVEQARPPVLPQRELRREHQPPAPYKPGLARRVAPAAPVVEPQPPAAAAERSPSIVVLDAYHEFPDEQQREILSEEQRRVPRANTLLRAPQPLDPINPSYPRAALARGVRGQVLLEVFIGAGGAIDDIVVIDDFGKPELAEAAVQAVRRATFRLGESVSGATRSRVTLRVNFTYE